MENENVYLSLQRNVQLPSGSVHVKDIGEVFCEREDVMKKVQNTVVETLHGKETKVISAIYVIEQIQKSVPGSTIVSLGERDVILSVKKKSSGKGIEYLKVFLVSCVLFFGSAYTIMSFHGDTGMEETFFQIYSQVTGQAPDGITALEVSYSVGIVAGVLIFFNHISGKKITPEPTPIQVQMREYEGKVDQAFIENVSRKGSEESVK